MILDILSKATYDTEADTLYIYLRDITVKPTRTTQVTDTVLFDLDNFDNVIGIEILAYSKSRNLKRKKQDPYHEDRT